MPIEQFSFTPAIGLKDNGAFPTSPNSEADARQQIQTVLDQIKNYINNVIISSIAAGGIDDGGITTVKLAALAVTAAKLAVDSVETEKIKNLAVTTAKIQDAAITGAKIADDAINTEHISNDAVTESKIANSAITDAQIANNAIKSQHLVSGIKVLNDVLPNTEALVNVVIYDDSGPEPAASDYKKGTILIGF